MTRPKRTIARTVITGDLLSLQVIPFGIPRPVREYQFHPTRKWRADYCWEHEQIIVEIEGGVFSGGRHTRGRGYLNDCEKYNEAQRLGFRVFRFTPQQITDGTALAFLRRVFASLD